MPVDMLVNLYGPGLANQHSFLEKLEKEGIAIKRALPLDKTAILQYVQKNFTASWVHECEAALFNKPVSCFIAVQDRQIIGFACYEATAKGYFGPTGVSGSLRGKGIGAALTRQSLLAMKEEGYGYAVIGWVDEVVEFYRKSVGAIVIPDTFPALYSRMRDK